ncbi:hypothetical protein [Paraburkholderia sp. BR10882]|uniref:hypothetical protein n=1 Tax=unclassified Paraburkholderia TaxID=2615204 RepID=UPI0034CFA59C
MSSNEQQSKRLYEAADEADAEHAEYFAMGQHWGRTYPNVNAVRRVADIDTDAVARASLVESAWGSGVDLYAAVEGIDDMADGSRIDLEATVEALIGEPYPEVERVIAFIEGVADVVDERITEASQ